MFKNYRDIFRNMRDLQDRLWRESMANFPGAGMPAGMNKWQQGTLENVHQLVGQAVSQTLDMQRQWLDQWAERAGSKDLKPKTFAELSAEARDSTGRWLDNQRLLWDQWLKLVRGSATRGATPDFAAWESAVQDSMKAQMALLNEWSDMADFKKLSGKEVSKLSNQIVKAMEKSIETQQRLWDHWFDQLAEPAAKAAPGVAKKKANAPAKAKKPAAKPAGAGDDLKQIAGIGPGLEKKLKENGVKTLKQIAALKGDDIARLEEKIVQFSGRIKRDKWVEQAKKLTASS